MKGTYLIWSGLCLVLAILLAVLFLQSQPSQREIVSVEVDSAPFKGPVDAPITIVEFSDFECPYCQSFYKNTYPKVLETYKDKSKFVYKHFPIEKAHPLAFDAAVASTCAYLQGQSEDFFNYHDLLFERVGQWKTDKGAFTAYAQELGYEMERFNNCLNSSEARELVKRDMAEGGRLGVKGVPTFFINGQKVEGAVSFTTFAKTVEGLSRN